MKKCARLWPESQPEGQPQRRSHEFQQTLGEALRFNQKLWTLLQVELSNPENGLPQSLRTNLLRLSRHIDQKTFLLFSGGDLRDLQMLSKINEEIAAGLLAGAEKGKRQDTIPDKVEDTRRDSENSAEEQQVFDVTA